MKELFLSEKEGSNLVAFLVEKKEAKVKEEDLGKRLQFEDNVLFVRVHPMRRTAENTEVTCSEESVLESLLNEFAVWKTNGDD